MTTYSDLKKARRKQQKEELKRIESVLHPCLNIGGIEILHEHKGQKITFSAWDDDKPINNRYSEFTRLYVLHCMDFYIRHANDLKWLTEKDD